MISMRTSSLPKEDVVFPTLLYCDSRCSQACRQGSQASRQSSQTCRWHSKACCWHPEACCQHSQVLPGARKVLCGAPRCSQTYHNHSYSTPAPVITDPSDSEGQPECPPRVWSSPEINASKFTLHILSDTPGGSHRLNDIVLMLKPFLCLWLQLLLWLLMLLFWWWNCCPFSACCLPVLCVSCFSLWLFLGGILNVGLFFPLIPRCPWYLLYLLVCCLLLLLLPWNCRCQSLCNYHLSTLCNPLGLLLFSCWVESWRMPGLLQVLSFHLHPVENILNFLLSFVHLPSDFASGEIFLVSNTHIFILRCGFYLFPTQHILSLHLLSQLLKHFHHLMHCLLHHCLQAISHCIFNCHSPVDQGLLS